MVVSEWVARVWLILGRAFGSPQTPSVWTMLSKGAHRLEAVQDLALSASHSA